MENRLCIKNACVIDGTGAKPYQADVLICGDRIARVGQVEPGDMRVIDGSGKLCTPGFIDVHTHSDISLLYCGVPRGHILQGITSEVIGNCGYSPFPLRDDPAFIEKRRASLSFIDTRLVEWDWRGFDGYCARLTGRPINVNVRALVGYGSIRAYVMDYADRAPSNEEQARIDSELDAALKAGTCGLSIGLGYAPDFYAGTEELTHAARIVQDNGKIFAFHIRGERMTLFPAIEEVVRIALETGVRTEISHLKCAGKSNHGQMAQVLEFIEAANRRGADITFDLYPYEAGCSYLGLVFPPKYHEGGIGGLLERLGDAAALPQILRDMGQGYPGWSTFIGEQDGENLLIVSTRSGQNVGRTVAELGRAWGIGPYKAAVRLMLENEGIVEMVMFQCVLPDVELAEEHPLGMFGSDGLAIDPDCARLRERAHPRYYGAFPRALERWAQRRPIALEALIHKMTGLPAQRFGFTDRGRIAEGSFADLCLFRLEDIQSRASYSDPNQLPVGMEAVVVNGCLEVEGGASTGAASGRLLL